MRAVDRTPRLAPLLLSLTILASGCAALQSMIGLTPRRPSVRLGQIQVVSIEPQAMTLEVHLHVTNPNTFAITMTELKYKITGMGIVLATGHDVGPTTFEPEQTRESPIRVTLDPTRAIEFLEKVFQLRKDIRVDLEGAATFDVGVLGSVTLPLHESAAINRLTR